MVRHVYYLSLLLSSVWQPLTLSKLLLLWWCTGKKKWPEKKHKIANGSVMKLSHNCSTCTVCLCVAKDKKRSREQPDVFNLSGIGSWQNNDLLWSVGRVVLFHQTAACTGHEVPGGEQTEIEKKTVFAQRWKKKAQFGNLFSACYPN